MFVQSPGVSRRENADTCLSRCLMWLAMLDEPIRSFARGIAQHADVPID